MKQLYGKLWAKCTAIALLIVFAVLLAASALGIAYLINYGAYADGGEQVRQIAENNLLQQTSRDGWAALHARFDRNKHRQIQTSSTYKGSKSLIISQSLFIF